MMTSWHPTRLTYGNVVGLICCSSALLGCGATGGNGAPSDDPMASPFGSPVSVLSTEPARSEVTGLCQITQTPETELVSLDLETFINRLADYSVGWMTPLHEALLGLNEPRVLETMIETVAGTFDTHCQSAVDYEALPPDNELIDPQNQADARQGVVDLFADATVLESGNKLRLSVPPQTCSGCSQPLGQEPIVLDARLTASGTLLIDVELAPGNLWARNVTVSQNKIAFQGPLDALYNWGRTATEETRSGTTVLPATSGTMTFGAQKDNQGAISAWLGISEFHLVADPGTENEITFSSDADCLGMEVKLALPETGASVGANLGPLDILVPGSRQCPVESSCGAKERTGPSLYHFGNTALIFTQPPQAAAEDVSMLLRMGSASSVAVGGDVFASVGLGPGGEGGDVTVASQQQSGDYLVTFQPALDMRAALTISQLSEEMRMTLPDWLNDEIFDLTFGGDATPSILVPRREACPTDGTTLLEPARREVRVLSGSGQLAVGGGRVLEASAGQCIGRSLADPDTFTLTSDFWEAGFPCSP